MCNKCLVYVRYFRNVRRFCSFAENTVRFVIQLSKKWRIKRYIQFLFQIIQKYWLQRRLTWKNRIGFS